MHATIRLWVPVQLAVLAWSCAGSPPAPPQQIASAAPVSAAGALPAADGASVDQSLVQRGYHPRTVNGELKYCRSETVTGSLFSSTVCLSPTAIKMREENAQNSIGMAHRGDGGCAKTPCT